MNVFLIGPMAAGKSSVGKLLAALLDRQFLDTDLILENLMNISIQEMFEQYGEDFFRQQESIVLHNLVLQSNLVVATGGGIILSAENRRVLCEHGKIYYLQVNQDNQMLRLANSYKRPLHPNLINQTYRENIYLSIADKTIDTNGKDTDYIAQQLYIEIINAYNSF